ncbi:hypothetical protein B0H14DRAFT_2591125 [Mycena olivaceomarginata]|nr:hypothetical protein B0H14DRAFT_2591125 [Mycena olivaceomarginata]
MSAPVPSYPPPMFPAQPMDHDVDMGFPEIDDAQLMEQLGQTDLVDEGPTPEEIHLLCSRNFSGCSKKLSERLASETKPVTDLLVMTYQKTSKKRRMMSAGTAPL